MCTSRSASPSATCSRASSRRRRSTGRLRAWRRSALCRDDGPLLLQPRLAGPGGARLVVVVLLLSCCSSEIPPAPSPPPPTTDATLTDSHRPADPEGDAARRAQGPHRPDDVGAALHGHVLQLRLPLRRHARAHREEVPERHLHRGEGLVFTWVPAHTINFAFIPTEQRLLYINTVQIFFNISASVIWQEGRLDAGAPRSPREDAPRDARARARGLYARDDARARARGGRRENGPGRGGGKENGLPPAHPRLRAGMCRGRPAPSPAPLPRGRRRARRARPAPSSGAGDGACRAHRGDDDENQRGAADARRATAARASTPSRLERARLTSRTGRPGGRARPSSARA